MMNSPNALNLASVLEQSAKIFPKKTAVIFNETKLTFSQLNAMSNQIANGLLSKGIKQGDKVALSCINIPFFPAVYYAILKIGATVVPLNILLKRNEIVYHLEDSNAQAYLAFIGTKDLPMGQEAYNAVIEVKTCKYFCLITPSADMQSPFSGVETIFTLMKNQSPNFHALSTESSDDAVILYTSGTTGKPKGAILTHSNIFQNAMGAATLFRSSSVDIHLIVLPLFHSFGQVVQMNQAFLVGSTVVLLPRFTPDTVLKAFQEENITIFCGVPTMYWAILHYPEKNKFDLAKISKTLRLGASGGSALPVEVIKQFEQEFHIPIIEGYGLSEASPVVTFSRTDLPKKPGSIGVAIQGVDILILGEDGKEVSTGQIGELVARGHGVMKGYLGKPEETAKTFKDGWLHTGDLAKQDEDGYYYIVDRLKDMIIRGGENVYPREVEEILMTHPDVSLATVVGIPHEQYGEEIKAFVVLKQNSTLSEQQLIAWSKEHMAAYKYPRFVEFRTALPMNATGKILKRELKH